MSLTMSSKNSFREALDSILNCPLCLEEDKLRGVFTPTGWTNLGEGPEPCECNTWGFPYIILADIIVNDKEKPMTEDELQLTYQSTKYYYEQLERETDVK